jgi:hypothetical protein
MADQMAHFETTEDMQKSQACYAQGKYRHDAEGHILNELGRIANPGDIIMRASNGYPTRRMGDKQPVMVDLKTGKVAEEA